MDISLQLLETGRGRTAKQTTWLFGNIKEKFFYLMLSIPF